MLLKTYLPGFRQRLNSLRKGEYPEGREERGWGGGKGLESLESEGWGREDLEEKPQIVVICSLCPKRGRPGRLDPGEKKVSLSGIQENTYA